MYGGGMYGGGAYGQTTAPTSASPLAAQNPAILGPSGPADLTGSYLGSPAYGGQQGPRLPHVIPNPFDNTLLIQGTPQEYEQIMGLLRQLDVPPRQVLIDAKIYEVALNGGFAGVGRASL